MPERVVRTRLTCADAALVVGATLRLTRLVTNDDLGRWWVKDPLDAWVHGHGRAEQRFVEELRSAAEGGDAVASELLSMPVTSNPRRLRFHRYLHGLECPHCVGYWVGVATVASYLVARRRPRALAAWRTVAATLGLNTLVVALGDRIEYWD